MSAFHQGSPKYTYLGRKRDEQNHEPTSSLVKSVFEDRKPNLKPNLRNSFQQRSQSRVDVLPPYQKSQVMVKDEG
jgi:hypothetical protein